MSLARFMASSVPPTLVRGRLEGFFTVCRCFSSRNARRWSLLILGVRALGWELELSVRRARSWPPLYLSWPPMPLSTS
jgi:hypothetical protein